MADAGGDIEARAWVVTAHGDPTAVLEQQTISVRAPGPNEVRLASRAFCLNFNDIDIIRGRYATLMLEPPFTPGMEAVGTVESAGPGAEHLVGRRVVGIPVLAHGGYASHVVVHAATALELPGWVDDADGAALHYPFHLGWFALHERARLQPGEALLVHAAAGGTGSGALQMGKALTGRGPARPRHDPRPAAHLTDPHRHRPPPHLRRAARRPRIDGTARDRGLPGGGALSRGPDLRLGAPTPSAPGGRRRP